MPDNKSNAKANAKANVYLIGPMGSGKTTIGQRLASKLGLQFQDSDHEIEASTGASVNLIFDIEGEEGFRKRENKMLGELAAKPGVLIATGGGAVLSKINRDLLNGSGIVVYLKTSVEQQLARLGRDRSRPLLQTQDKEQRLATLAEQRNPFYEALADVVFPVQDRNVDSAVNQIYDAICTYRLENSADRTVHES
jgi:shikimate kinase